MNLNKLQIFLDVYQYKQKDNYDVCNISIYKNYTTILQKIYKKKTVTKYGKNE